MSETRIGKLRVIVGVDFTEASDAAIVEAIHLARLLPLSDLQFVHVVAPTPDSHDAHASERMSEALGLVLVRLEKHVRNALFLHGNVERWGCEVAFHVRVGAPAEEIHQIAVDADVDLIIVGPTPIERRHRLRRLFQPSTGDELVRRAHVPVLVSHPKDFTGLGKRALTAASRRYPDASAGSLSTYSYIDFTGERAEGLPLHADSGR